MPNGWQLFDQWQPCSFHSVQLTKIDGSAYWASFFNYFYQNENKYYPTSLVLISRKVSDQTEIQSNSQDMRFTMRQGICRIPGFENGTLEQLKAISI